ncbi:MULTISPECIES: YceD family protein [Parachlamydia]|jgi:uncharacterized metal-binding protein YceD (DUF177 family)|uniref:DUF177 domain-containing protein n=1 Tax=Parachlamydia acanthamoebae TaxID=83552 RepID=A0A0C1E488_9BACT|nr:hypothetical protein [Parachlamydia acanthamoebae]EFB42517.1 hypothetical protein pah_c005o053 [Parachlamydia acanthamoebae str. Hall's coccus]KIA76242.1 hypothetical protein DB43_AQ00480 [Parachlamydia acanthamoebae]
MERLFKIYVDRLKTGDKVEIHETVSPDFLDVHEDELSFKKPVVVDGEAYLAGDELILHLQAEAEAHIPCAICNEDVSVGVFLESFYHAEPLAKIKTGIFDYQELLRESILLETPEFVECEGNCPKREKFKKYLKTNDSSSNGGDPDGHQPFSDLELN